MKFKLPLVGEIRFNPIVSGLAIALIWGFVAWCAIQGEDVPFIQWKAWIVAKFTWLYVGSQDLWAVFAIVLYCRLVIPLVLYTQFSATRHRTLKLDKHFSYFLASTPISNSESQMRNLNSMM